MKQIVFAFSLLGCLFGSLPIYAQDIPVDLLTGKAQVSIPLWQLRNNAVTAPVSLVFNGGGIKVTDNEGNAGMGWNVTTGGQISREVRGLPDDLVSSGNNGWLSGTLAQDVQNFNPTASATLSTCEDEANDFTQLTALTTSGSFYKDTEPDLFSFSAPGIAGQFVFDASKNIRLIPYQDLRVTYTRDGSNKINTFLIITNQGVRYEFNLALGTTKRAIDVDEEQEQEYLLKDRLLYSSAVTYNYSWPLTKIKDTGNGAIDFSYTSTQTVPLDRYIMTTEAVLFQMNEQMQVANVSKINDPFNEVNFLWTYYGVLHSVSVNGVKQFMFIYDRIRNVNDPPVASVTGNQEAYRSSIGTKGKTYSSEEPQFRSFLSELRELGNDCAIFSSHQFAYYDVSHENKTTSIPFKTRFGRDLWGYYNGKPEVESSLIPRLYVKTSAIGIDRIRIQPHPADAGYVATDGTDRSPNPATIHYGSLKTITYPTGGTAEITYEPADYYDSLANTTYQGGGVRVKKVVISDGDAYTSNDITKLYSYQRTDGQSSGKFIYPPTFGFYAGSTFVRTYDNLAPESGLVYTRAWVAQTGKGRMVFEYSAPGTFQQTQVRDWTTPYSRIARTKISGVCPSAGSMQNGYYNYPFAPSVNFDFERGLVQRISMYDESNRLVQQKTYTYQRLATTPVFIKAIQSDWLKPSVRGYAVYSLLANASKVRTGEKVESFDVINGSAPIQSITNYQYSTSHFMLNELSTTDSRGEVHKTKIKYAKDFAAITSPTTTAGQALLQLNTEINVNGEIQQPSRHGTSVESINSLVKNGVETVTDASLTLYKIFGGTILPAERLSYSGGLGFHESYLSSPNTFSYSGYRSVQYIDDYNSKGQVLTTHDLQNNMQSVLYNSATSLPVATIQNARWDEVVINSSTEIVTSSGVAAANKTVTDPYTGEFSYHFFLDGIIRKTGVKRNTANRYYRFACRIRNGQATNLIVKALEGTTVKASATVTYPAASVNQWKYIEMLIDMNTVGATFNLEVAVPINTDFDYLAFYPQKSTVGTQVVHPVYGILSQTDTHGISAFQEYDAAGRLKYVKDQDRNIVKIQDYQYKLKYQNVIARYYNTNGFSVGGLVKFDSYGNSCLSGLTYRWYVNGALKKTDTPAGGVISKFEYTFDTDQPLVTLVVSHPVYGSDTYYSVFKAAVDSPDPEPPGESPLCSPTVTVRVSGSTTITSCDDATWDLTANIANTGNCIYTPTVGWQYRVSNPAFNFVPYPESAGLTQLHFSTSGLEAASAFDVRAYVIDGQGHAVYGAPFTLTILPGTQCQ